MSGRSSPDAIRRINAPAPRIRRLLVLGLTAVLAGGCASPWHASRNKVSSSPGSRITNVKQFVDMPRVGLPFDEED